MDTKIFLILLVFSLGSMILGGILESSGLWKPEPLGARGVAAVKIAYFALFCLAGFSLVPLAIQLFIFLQIKIGNGDFAPIRWLRANESLVVYCIWGIYLIGLGIILRLAKPSELFQ